MSGLSRPIEKTNGQGFLGPSCNLDNGKTVTGDDGSVTQFDKLLLATGRNPLIPSMRERRRKAFFVFRNLDTRRWNATGRSQGGGGRWRTAGTRSGARPAGAGMQSDGSSPSVNDVKLATVAADYVHTARDRECGLRLETSVPKLKKI
jgi:hypothetical protein